MLKYLNPGVSTENMTKTPRLSRFYCKNMLQSSMTTAGRWWPEILRYGSLDLCIAPHAMITYRCHFFSEPHVFTSRKSSLSKMGWVYTVILQITRSETDRQQPTQQQVGAYTPTIFTEYQVNSKSECMQKSKVKIHTYRKTSNTSRVSNRSRVPITSRGYWSFVLIEAGSLT